MNGLSRHAVVRQQQRGIPPLVLDLLLQFGSEEAAAGGVSKVFFDKKARRRVEAYAGPLAQSLREHLDVYAVVGQHHQVITVGHRLDRIRRS